MQITQVDPLHRSSWYTPQQCKEYYGKPYKPIELHIHWWDNPAKKPTHSSVVDFIKNKTSGSVNYVASAGKVTRMVPEENCALTTQGGNPYGIKIECSPYGTDADYRTFAELIADIWKRRGILPLVPHNKYYNTECPGTLNLTRMATEANKILREENDMFEGKTSAEWAALAKARQAPDKVIDEEINRLHVLGYGRDWGKDPAKSKAIFENLRPLFRNNFHEASLQVMRNIEADPTSLLNGEVAELRQRLEEVKQVVNKE